MENEMFAKLIKEFRIATNKSLYDLAQICKTGAGTISRWENELAAPPMIAQMKILNLLKGINEDRRSICMDDFCICINNEQR